MFDLLIKNRIVDLIIDKNDFFGPQGIMVFLEKIWPLRSMPSQDDRFKDAYGDIRQHVVNNDDWTWKELFYERLDILHGDEQYFTKLIETVVHPEIRNNIDEIRAYVNLINSELQSTNKALRISQYLYDKPEYHLRDRSFQDIAFVDEFASDFIFLKKMLETLHTHVSY